MRGRHFISMRKGGSLCGAFDPLLSNNATESLSTISREELYSHLSAQTDTSPHLALITLIDGLN